MVGSGISNIDKLIVSEIGGSDRYFSRGINGNTNQFTEDGWKTVLTPLEILDKEDFTYSYSVKLKNDSGDYLVNTVYAKSSDMLGEVLPYITNHNEYNTDLDSLMVNKDKVWKKERVKMECQGAAGDAVILSAVDKHKNNHFVSYKDLLIDEKSDFSIKSLCVAAYMKGGLVLESFFRWNHSDRIYMGIWKSPNSDLRKYEIMDLTYGSSSSLITRTVKDSGYWKYPSIHSVLFNPESKGGELFAHPEENKDYGAFTIHQGSGNAFGLNRIKGEGFMKGEVYNIFSVELNSYANREFNPRNEVVGEVFQGGSDGDGSEKSEIKTYVNPSFATSLKPIGEKGAERATLLNGIYWHLRSSSRNTNINYFEEAYYYLPMLIADKLNRNGYFTEALDWYRLVYDYSNDTSNSKIFPRLKYENSHSMAYKKMGGEVNDLENPHNIARDRKNAFSRYTLPAIARCLIEYGDNEFTKDTSESISRAFGLYEKALEVLAEVGFNNTMTECELAIENIDLAKTSDVGFAQWLKQMDHIKAKLSGIKLYDVEDTTDDLKGAIAYIETRLGTSGTVNTTSNTDIALKLTEIETRVDEILATQVRSLDFDTTSAFELKWIPFLGIKLPILTPGELSINYNFALPRNPVKDYLMMYAEVNLFKMRNGMNIAGMVRSLDVYATSPR